MPYGDMPGIELDFYAQTLDILRSVKVHSSISERINQGIEIAKANRPRGIGWLSIHAYSFNGSNGYATFYEQRETGTGFYYRLRTVEEMPGSIEQEVKISDYAVKPLAPGRSANWLIAIRSLEDGKLLHREDGQSRAIHADLHDCLQAKGTDLKPGIFHPRTNEDYKMIKLKLSKATAVLGKLHRESLMTDLDHLDPLVYDYVAMPITFRFLGPKFW